MPYNNYDEEDIALIIPRDSCPARNAREEQRRDEELERSLVTRRKFFGVLMGAGALLCGARSFGITRSSMQMNIASRRITRLSHQTPFSPSAVPSTTATETSWRLAWSAKRLRTRNLSSKRKAVNMVDILGVDAAEVRDILTAIPRPTSSASGSRRRRPSRREGHRGHEFEPTIKRVYPVWQHGLAGAGRGQRRQ